MNTLPLNKSCSGTEVNNVRGWCFECFDCIRANMMLFEFSITAGFHFLEIGIEV